MLMLLENWLVYHPTSARAYWLPPPNPRVQDVELRTADGARLHAWWCPTVNWEPAQGALLYCHGNAGNLSYRSSSVVQWHEAFGVAVLIFDYPGYGKSEGSPSEAGCYAAADAAYAWLTQEQRVPADQILIYGKSLGAGVAVDLASRHPHQALILAKAFTSLPDMAQSLYPWLPARWLVRNKFDNLAKIGQCTRPIFVAHGAPDSLIPLDHGQRLFDAANEPKHFLAMPGIDHNDPLPVEFFAELGAFLADSG